MTRDGQTVDIGRLLDEGRWSGFQRGAVLLTALAIIFDGVDNQLIGISVPSLMAEWSAERGDFALAISAGYFGMMVGAASAGVVGDLVGRRAALAASMFVFGAMTLATAYAGGVDALVVLRFFTGIGLGGALPNAAALAAEYVPLRLRAIAVTITIVCVPFGAMLAGLVAVPLLPSIGWRGLFLAGGTLPTLAALLYLKLLPESPRYLVGHPHRHQELARTLTRMGHAVPDHAVFVDRVESSSSPRGRDTASFGSLLQPAYRRDTLALWTSFVTCLLAVYLAFSWVPALLAEIGFPQAVASSGITVFNLGGVAGALAGGALIARFGSRGTMLAMSGSAAIASGILSLMNITVESSAMPIIVMLGIAGALINGVQTTMYALAAHVYPAAIRATGVGTAVSVGRLGAILSGYAGAWAIEYAGSFSFFMTMTVAMTACWLALAMVRRHIAGRT